MGFDADEEILQDFVVEAGEILELLSEQLVELESSPDDMNLLNAIFRGFHTVKGGAGFLQFDELVSCCHVAENVFDILRKGERRVTPELMDVVLEALDSVNAMFQEVREGMPLTPASDALLAELEQLALPEALDGSAVESASLDEAQSAASALDGDDTDLEFEYLLNALDAPAQASSAAADSDIITDDEFEALLDQLHGADSGPTSAPSGDLASDAADQSQGSSSAQAGDEISDDEFEALLDQLHGEGQFNAQLATPTASVSEPSAGEAQTPGSGDADSTMISDDEFEQLLDELHGKGQFKGALEGHKAPAVEPAVDSGAAAQTQVKTSQAAASPAKSRQPAAAKRPVAARQVAEVETSVRVDTARLDEIMNMVGELVLVRNRLVRLGAESADETVSKVVANLDVVTGDLQAAVMKTRMQPIKKVFGRFPRLVRDMARNLKKNIRLELQGEETDLDKNLVEALADPLVHLVRNSVDHGIESPAERLAAGKEAEGCVVLAASQEGDHIQLTITDDGKGMDAAVLRNKAVEKGMLDKEAAERLTDHECHNLIFAAGFSTKTEVTDVSGRGVGMDVVKTKIAQLNGTVSVFSTLGQGSQVVIKVPLTLAIMPTLMVMLDSQAFAFPLVNVNEIFHLDLSRTNIVDGQEVVIVRGKALPLFYLKHWLLPAQAHEDKQKGHVVILTVGNERVGCVVDQLVGQEEVVIKPLGKLLHGTPGMSGATITGDGRIALILDIPGLLKHYGQRY